MNTPPNYPVEMLYRPAAFLRIRPRTRGNYCRIMNKVYAEAHGVGLIMDVFQPKDGGSGTAVIDVVSGGWYSDRVMLNEHIGFGMIDALCERGITVFAVSPGSITLFTGFEMVRHIHAAIRHIKNTAEEYAVAPESIGILGVSAGGHLASLAALTPQKARPSSHDALRRWSTDVAAAALFFPPTDLLDYNGLRFDQIQIDGIEPGRLLSRENLDGKPETDLLRKLADLSPARLPIHNPPPFMIVQGKADPIVPWEQAEKLASALRRASGKVMVQYKEDGGHLWPDIRVEVEQMAAWLEQTLAARTS